MGFRICYLAARLEPEIFARSLGLQVTEQTDELPVDYWWAARLKNGWTILWAEDETFGASNRERIEQLSNEADIVHCEVNETVMWCSAEYWSDGQSKWKVTHRGDGADRFDLTADGDLPAEFAEIRQQHFQAQKDDGEDVDHVFEIPLDLARSIIDFRHEEFLESDDVDTFFVLNPPAKKGILARLFGR